MLTKLFAPLAVRIFGGLAVFLLLALTVQTARMHHYHADRDRWHTAFDAQKAAYVAEQKAALAKAIAAKLASEAAYRVKAEKIDDEYQTALARAQRASDAYRLRSKIPRSPSSGTPSPANGGSPESPDRSGENAELVAVGRDDFEILVENSVRLEAAHDWAKTLNGGAVPDPAFGRKGGG